MGWPANNHYFMGIVL